MRIYLSPSQVATADNCRRQHWYRSIRKVKVTAPAANLTFGACLDIAAREYLHAITLGLPVPDPASRFLELWLRARAESPLTYASTHTPQGFEQMGWDLMKRFPGAWEQTGFQIVQDSNARPLINVRLEVSMGKRAGIEVILTGVLDLVAYNADIELGVLDVKSSAVVHTAPYALHSNQLTAYQVLLGAYLEPLGLPRIAWLGFWDMLKRKEARIEDPVCVRARRVAQLREFQDKLFWLAEDIKRSRFPEASRLQHNTPCNEQCDFLRACTEDDEEGLLFPGEAPKKPVRLTDASTSVR